ncbi:hypothetical protein BSKO_12803 [Bryopsis sp. KO-2023]|nr:hypothetical protein BSKO_12803 [Bryopsis sp. KO-2023]
MISNRDPLSNVLTLRPYKRGGTDTTPSTSFAGLGPQEGSFMGPHSQFHLWRIVRLGFPSAENNPSLLMKLHPSLSLSPFFHILSFPVSLSRADLPGARTPNL